MGNRTFLSVNQENLSVGSYADVAFETNNFIAPLWFCVVSQERYEQYREQVLAAWQAVEPLLEQEEEEDSPEREAFWDSLNLHIPWEEALQQMNRSLPAALSRFPALGTYVSAWMDTLWSHIAGRQSMVIHLELGQFFGFFGEPKAYLKSIEDCLTLWRNPDSAWFERHSDQANAYMLGGEHLPKRAESLEEVDSESVLTVDTGRFLGEDREVSSPKKSTKWVQELYTWLLAIVLAGLFIAIWVWSGSIGRALLACLIPIAVIVLWELRKRPKPANSPGSRRTGSPREASQAMYYTGSSPITSQGLEARQGNSRESFIVRWPHNRLTRIDAVQQLELVLHPDYAQLYPSHPIVALDGKTKSEHVAAAAACLTRLSQEA
ncbi:hypothetical protein WMW72_09165 [Paenibacillus filicis]|uniref:Uncharacterized protein n=1 Tax=Paenibacillus filicis TaxID=669464 RepID=A0ABU9DJ31_9BACL